MSEETRRELIVTIRATAAEFPEEARKALGSVSVLRRIGQAAAMCAVVPSRIIQVMAQREDYLNQVAALGGSKEAAEQAELVAQMIAQASVVPNADLWQAGWQLTIAILKEGEALPPESPAAWAKRLHKEVHFYGYATQAVFYELIWEMSHREEWERLAALGWSIQSHPPATISSPYS